MSKNIKNNTIEEKQQQRFCLLIQQMLTKGEPPNSWQQFFEDFYFTFKNHWKSNINDKIVEKILSLNIKWYYLYFLN